VGWRSHGNYYFASNAASLPGIVSDIAAWIQALLGR